MLNKLKLGYPTDVLPVAGGGIGAYSQASNILAFFPTAETIISSIVITAIGAIVGYLIKLALDKIFKKKNV